jgi:hypothetical protein
VNASVRATYAAELMRPTSVVYAVVLSGFVLHVCACRAGRGTRTMMLADATVKSLCVYVCLGDNDVRVFADAWEWASHDSRGAVNKSVDNNGCMVDNLSHDQVCCSLDLVLQRRLALHDGGAAAVQQDIVSE